MILSNKQVGNTCGFFAMAFVYGRICRDRQFGKMADKAIRNSVFGSRSHIGEIFSMNALYNEWMLQFDSYTKQHGYVAEIVTISNGADALNLLAGEGFVILPVSTGSGMPHFSVLYGTSDRYYYRDGRTRTRKNVSPHELYCLHAKVCSSFDFSGFPFGGKRYMCESWFPYIRRKLEGLRNYSLYCSLRACENMAALYLLEDPNMRVRLKGQCLYIHR